MTDGYAADPGRTDGPRMKVLLTLRHEDLVPFIRRYYFAEITWVVLAHNLISVLFLALWIQAGVDAGASAGEWFGTIGWALLLFIVLVPLHEGIHAAGYLLSGANDIRFVLSAEHAYAAVVAHRHVVGVREFTWLVIAPFIVVTCIAAVVLAVVPGSAFLLMAVLLLHTLGCIGDWAMLNVLWHNRREPLYTFDDAEEGATYFVTIEDSGTHRIAS